ncbi:MAG TPA: TetR/AcrR family transcriptional regulator [Dehalococcoidia bacterium]|nr:TetR/AcrR family transcriptional regulator [Dehalococcoidia bacterium]
MSPTRGPSSRNSRRAILDAALELFASRGYEETTIEDVRLASGASTGSIYHHFKSKHALATALYLEGVEAYQRAFMAVLAACPDAESGVKATVRHYLTWTAQNPKLAHFMLTLPESERREIATVRPDVSWRFVAETGAWRRRYTATGVLRVMADDLYRAVVIGPAEAYARRWLAGLATTPLEQAIQELAEAAWRAVKAPAPGIRRRQPEADMPAPAASSEALNSTTLDEVSEVAGAAWDVVRLTAEA